MSIRGHINMIQRWGDRISNIVLRAFSRAIASVLRALFSLGIARRHSNTSVVGFVLPTTVLLLLVVSLAVGSIGLRTLSRTKQVIGDRQQRIIYNAATPAIDRAKAKISYLIERHQKPTPGIPSENDLVKMMRNQEIGFADESVDSQQQRIGDIYTFDSNNTLETERRIDVNDDGEVDNAWMFLADTDGDDFGDSWVAYSILFETPNPVADDPNDPNDTGIDTINALRDVRDATIQTRATNLEVRNGPRSLLGSSDRCPAVQQGSVEEGWFSDETNTTFLRKNFQINAIVIPGIVEKDENGNPIRLVGPNPNATASTLEMQQDRTFNVGNKWGAWFQGDLEIFPGPGFNWNGAMRTQGSLIAGKSSFTAYLISSKFSCFNFDKAASEIRVGKNVISGQVDADNNTHLTGVHLFTGYATPPNDGVLLNPEGDSVDYDGLEDLGDVLLLDPVKLFLRGDTEFRDDPTTVASITIDLNAWRQRDASERISIVNNANQTVNYGDTYRNDHRLGPTPVKGGLNKQGDWEAQAYQEGMRVIVGQRLELGTPLEPWAGDSCENSGDSGTERCHEARQRRTLKDNLSAVQATAIYRANVTTRPFQNDEKTPLACLATTVHPGTATTLKRSSTFHDVNQDLGGSILADPDGDAYLAIEDFFTGRGTNGWEFEPPNQADQVPMKAALENLAYFAGDPKGGAPYFPPVQDDVVHPYPELAKWGDFSILRRILVENEQESDALADQTVIDTASCMLGMLAHNIAYLNSFDLSIIGTNDALYGDLNALSDRLNSLATGTGVPAGVTAQNAGNPEPEAFIRSLEQWRNSTDPAVAAQVPPKMINIARLLMTKEQVRRDRDYGFTLGGTATEPTGRTGCLDHLKRPTTDPITGITSDTWPGLANLCSDQPRYPALHSIFPGDVDLDGTPGENRANIPFSTAGGDVQIEVEATRGFDPTTPVPADPATNPNYISGAGGVNDAMEGYSAFSDNDIAQMALKPKPMNQWVLPHKATTAADGAPNSSVNVLIKCENSLAASIACDGEIVRVAFKDAALMDGRQLMNVRVLDLDMDLLSDTSITIPSRGGDSWLPEANSTLLYLFREDAVREDGIVRPVDPNRNAVCDSDVQIRTEDCWLNAGNVSAYDSTDPKLVPVSTEAGDYSVSIKPVDYWTDPDRRPYGFRLRNGADLSRSRRASVNESISVISDNSIYLLGDFNLHNAYGAGELQEFTGGANNLINYNNFADNFYDRGDPDAGGLVNEQFAVSDEDQWRATEVLSDAVTLLSNNFCDGSVEDLFIYSRTQAELNDLDDNYGCAANNGEGYTSYTNSTRPNNTGYFNDWEREGFENNGGNFDDVPIVIAAHGDPQVLDPTSEDYEGDYTDVDAQRTSHMLQAAETTVNVGIFSAIVPSRTKQSYGGLHNFPRFLESWKERGTNNNIALNISGAFFQLGFSTSATAPYDQRQDTLEPETDSVNELVAGVDHEYYDPPQRNWGYDVAFQKNTPGKVAAKFVEPTSIVSEFYSEPEITDPYLSQLCKAINREANITAACPE